MRNHITASVEFYYKGEKRTASIELDVDQHMQAAGQLPDLYPLLAQTINLDLYSYEYEMLQSETILFSNAKGLTTEHLSAGVFDVESFRAAWTEIQTLECLQKIARQTLSIDDLQQHPELKKALLEAYRLGEETIKPV